MRRRKMFQPGRLSFASHREPTARSHRRAAAISAGMSAGEWVKSQSRVTSSLITLVVSPWHGVDVGAADAELAGRGAGHEARETGLEVHRESAGAVGRVVVHEEDVGVQPELVDLLAHARGILTLVVRRDEDEGFTEAFYPRSGAESTVFSPVRPGGSDSQGARPRSMISISGSGKIILPPRSKKGFSRSRILRRKCQGRTSSSRASSRGRLPRRRWECRCRA